ncbi:MAG: hypothetical protein QM734_16585 [Cyclobacteriaceae bacterium]
MGWHVQGPESIALHLLAMLYEAIDVNLPRTADKQALQGEKSEGRIKARGSFIFCYRQKEKTNHSCGHGDEVKGKENVKFIHASTSLGVVKTNLYAEYYLKRFRVARRILNNSLV